MRIGDLAGGGIYSLGTYPPMSWSNDSVPYPVHIVRVLFGLPYVVGKDQEYPLRKPNYRQKLLGNPSE